MRRFAASIIVVVPLVLAAAAAPPFVPVESEEEAVRETLGYYLQGHATGDPEVARQAFHPETMLYWIRDGQLQELTLDDYLARFTGEPAEDEADRRRRIAMVDIQGTAASARIELDYPGAFIVDYMSLLKIGGEWKIVNKIFDVERRGEE